MLVNEGRPYIIRTEKLTKTFATLTAVKDLDLQVMKGDIFGFLGHNGSGKTTTIRMVLGLIRPTAGNIYLFGLDTSTHLSKVLPRIGAIVEAPVFYPYLSGADNLRTVAAASQMSLGRVNQKRIDEVLDLIDLQHQAKDPYRAYSLETNEQQQLVLRVVAPVERSVEITAILARQNLFVAELSPFHTSLEHYFLELTEPGVGANMGMAQLASQTNTNR
jgi:ABC-type multidrug transport system ATPase subunit